jgi:hypothetical protein
MKIFLSYASPDKATAESTAFSLRSRGHKVFFDRDDLPPGASYDQQIERAIESCDFLVFLISPDSVAEGRYTLTELGFARRKWPHPGGHVLPIMTRKTPLEHIPSYLKAVTILEPAGNIAAEAGAAVDAMFKGLDVRTTILLSCAAAASSVLTFQAIAMNMLNPDFSLWFLLVSFTVKFVKLYLIPGCISGAIAGVVLRFTRLIYAIPTIFASGLLYAALTRIAFHFMPEGHPTSDIWLVIWSLAWSVGFGAIYMLAVSMIRGPRLFSAVRMGGA